MTKTKSRTSRIASYDANKPTAAAYGAMQAAYDFFNAELFGGELPPCLITLQRKKGAYGYFSPNRFSLVTKQEERGECTTCHGYGYFDEDEEPTVDKSGRKCLDCRGSGKGDHDTTDEIAMNPMYFAERPAIESLSTLVHEMAHLWQQHFGEAPRRCYHDKQWAAKMKSVGLWPSSTGCKGGKETGARVSHYIMDDGPYAVAFAKWDAQSDTPLFQDVGMLLSDGREAEKKKASKTKFSCPQCEVNAWGKPELHIVCGACEVRMEPQE